MQIKGQHDWTDYYRAQLLHLRPPQWARIIIYLFIGLWGLGFLGAVVFAIRGEFNWLYVTQGAILIVFLLVIRFYLTPRQARRTFAQQKELGVPWEMLVTETGLEISNEFGHARRPWGDFIKWKEDDDLLLLYESDTVYRVLPKRFFSPAEQLARLKQKLIESHVPVASGPTGCAVILLLVMILIIAALALEFALQP